MKSSNLLRPVLGFIFFQECCLCGGGTSILCPSCLDSLPRSHGKCLGCSRKNPLFGYCQACNKPYRPDLVIGLFQYKSKIKKIISLFKFEDTVSLAPILASKLFEVLKKKCKNPVLVPIPLSTSRRRFRGYNQSEILAKQISKLSSWQTKNILARQTSEFSQVEVKYRRERKRNIKGVFSFDCQEVPTEVVLIDDVITTGATIEEATKLLKKAGVKKVIVCALAMGE